jgi:hypothetical protein
MEGREDKNVLVRITPINHPFTPGRQSSPSLAVSLPGKKTHGHKDTGKQAPVTLGLAHQVWDVTFHSWVEMDFSLLTHGSPEVAVFLTVSTDNTPLMTLAQVASFGRHLQRCFRDNV